MSATVEFKDMVTQIFNVLPKLIELNDKFSEEQLDKLNSLDPYAIEVLFNKIDEIEKVSKINTDIPIIVQHFQDVDVQQLATDMYAVNKGLDTIFTVKDLKDDMAYVVSHGKSIATIASNFDDVNKSIPLVQEMVGIMPELRELRGNMDKYVTDFDRLFVKAEALELDKAIKDGGITIKEIADISGRYKDIIANVNAFSFECITSDEIFEPDIKYSPKSGDITLVLPKLESIKGDKGDKGLGLPFDKAGAYADMVKHSYASVGFIYLAVDVEDGPTYYVKTGTHYTDWKPVPKLAVAVEYEESQNA